MVAFEIRTLADTPVKGTWEITLLGGVSTAGMPMLYGGLQKAIDAGARILIVHLKDVPTMSSAPISALVAASEQLRVLGGRVILTGVSPKLKVIFDALSLEGAFSLYTVDEAHKAADAHAQAILKAHRLGDVPILDEPLTIGSDAKCTIVLKSAQAEAKHATVTRRGSEIVVRDLGSRYGTFVDGIRTREQVITPGMKLTIAGTTFVLNKPTAG